MTIGESLICVTKCPKINSRGSVHVKSDDFGEVYKEVKLNNTIKRFCLTCVSTKCKLSLHLHSK